MENVCSSCFSDEDLRAWIRSRGGPRGCDACRKHDSPTCDFEELCEYIQSCLEQYWSYADDHLPYESAEGGFQGATWETYDLLFEETGLWLPRNGSESLRGALLSGLPDRLWCEYDWLSLDLDDALRTSWQEFCETVKYRRRFFFHATGVNDRDSYTPASLLEEIARLSDRMGLVTHLSPGTKFWRARPDITPGTKCSAADFGPPPLKFALQSNRMNPPGIPMMYVASTARTALLETRAKACRIGQWEVVTALRVLDLRRLPGIPGYFSTAKRNRRLALRFLSLFAADIMTPVARDQRIHVDYLPSQVVTEYLRDYEFKGGKVDGISYGSTVHPAGWNVALFVGPEQLGLEVPQWGPKPVPSMKFKKSIRVHGSDEG